MESVYRQVKTPHKYGVVLRVPGTIIDCPSVFRFKNKWHMLYIQWTGEVGYETHLAESDDLLNWNPRGKVLSFRENDGDVWDKWQAGGTIQLVDHRWEGTHEAQSFAGKHWMSYIGGALKGYETDPLSIGMATTTTPDQPGEWNRIPHNPVMRPSDPDARPFERKTLYRSNIIWDKDETLRHPFVMFYNGKEQIEKKSIERIGIAVSQDMIHWSRYGDGPVIDNLRGISGDPQVIKLGDIWVMFYFGHAWKPAAFDTFACSHDLVNWTKWEGEHLTAPSEPWDHKFAHKPWVINHDGVIYHFYGAVGNENRVIGLATSKELK